jgi:flagellin
MISIASSPSTLFLQRQFGAIQSALDVTIRRLSSGLRINSAADDAAGLAISQRLEARIRGLDVGTRNANDAISMAQTADGALGGVEDALQRMRELAVQAANGTLTSADRDNLQLEFAQWQATVSDVIGGTTYQGSTLLADSATQALQVGPDAGDTVSLSLTDLSSLDGAGAASVTALSVAGADGSSATAALDVIDDAIASAASARAQWGASLNRMDAVVNLNLSTQTALSAARGRIIDADYAAETANRARLGLLLETSTAMMAQANAMPRTVVALLLDL